MTGGTRSGHARAVSHSWQRAVGNTTGRDHATGGTRSAGQASAVGTCSAVRLDRIAIHQVESCARIQVRAKRTSRQGICWPVCVKNPGFLNVQPLQIACLCSARLTACFPMDPGHRRSPACRLPERVVPVQLGEACQHTLHSSLFKCPHVSHADHLAWFQRVFLIDSLSAQSPGLPPSPQAPLFLHVTRL